MFRHSRNKGEAMKKMFRPLVASSLVATLGISVANGIAYDAQTSYASFAHGNSEVVPPPLRSPGT